MLQRRLSRLRRCRSRIGKPKVVRGDRLVSQRTLMDSILSVLTIDEWFTSTITHPESSLGGINNGLRDSLLQFFWARRYLGDDSEVLYDVPSRNRLANMNHTRRYCPNISVSRSSVKFRSFHTMFHRQPPTLLVQVSPLRLILVLSAGPSFYLHYVPGSSLIITLDNNLQIRQQILCTTTYVKPISIEKTLPSMNLQQTLQMFFQPISHSSSYWKISYELHLPPAPEFT
ncbi:hypothetical protein CR513_38446, partial [Mucuna pruriens]